MLTLYSLYSFSLAYGRLSRYMYGSKNFTKPGIPGSSGYLLGSPVRLPAPNVEPW